MVSRTLDVLSGKITAGDLLKERVHEVMGQTRPQPKRIATVKDVGSLVREVRTAKKMSQRDFADLAGVGRRFLSELENGKPTLEVGKVLATLLAAGIDIYAQKRQQP